MTKAKSQLFFSHQFAFHSIWQFLSIIWWFKINNLKSFTEVLLGKALKNTDSRTGRTLLNLFYIQGITVSQELEGNWAALCQLLNSLRSLTILSRLYKGNLKLWSPKYFFLKHPFFMLRFGVHSKWQVVGSWDTHCTQAIPKRTGTSPCGLKFTKSTVFPQKCLCLSECFSVLPAKQSGQYWSDF